MPTAAELGLKESAIVRRAAVGDVISSNFIAESDWRSAALVMATVHSVSASAHSAAAPVGT